jgi:hypothetical protein
MNNQYSHMRKFTKRINSIIDKERNKKSAPRSTKGLLARQNPVQEKPDVGEPDYTKRIANYVNAIREQRFSLNKNPREVIE